MDADLRQLTAESFAALQGTRFAVASTDFSFELVRVQQRDPSVPRPFSLIFRAPGPGVLEQRTYPLEHAELGELQIFLVPIGRSGDAVEYEAVFN